ncbi:hypothetical protein Dda_4752 [Drechslerella dactyloides]|uniref:Transcription factor TFIIIC triple barrel domain-containing protein n=1 Tax=Drechslerella dactyloides TaxID=74499 RepID=A0AAD6IXY0_DREDA|nr:hypothetical protein Dda_4752 [Drechslerella dactyloides]
MSTPLPGPTAAESAPVFADDEETESFYVVLDLSGDDFATYGRYRDGRAFRSSHGYDDSASDDSNGSRPPPSDDDELDEDTDDAAAAADKEGEAEDDEAADDSDDNSTSTRSSSSEDDPDTRETTLQILNLDSYNPLVNYQGKIYHCAWSTTTGTELIFDAPDTAATAANVPPSGTADLLSDAEDDEGEEGEKGRRLRHHPEARLLAATVHRLEGTPGKLRLRGRDKQEVSTKARMFAERLDAVLEHRLAEMAARGEDLSDVTMRKFSEGQQQQQQQRETSAAAGTFTLPL